MRSINAIMLGLAVAAVSAGCGSSKTASTGSPATQAADSNLGQVGLNLTVAPGIFINTAHAVISGGSLDGGTIAKDIPVSNSSKVTAVLGNIPFGTGYALDLTATPVDAADAATGLTCTGHATFDLTAAMTPDGGYAVVPVSINLFCKSPASNGSIYVNGILDVCPSITDFEVIPANVFIGGVMHPTATAFANNATPTYAWTAPAGLTIAGGNTATPSVTCAAPGSYALTLTLGAAADPTCAQTAIAPVECDTSAVCGNSICEAGEDSYSCPGDCGAPVCGDGKCQGSKICACQPGDAQCTTAHTAAGKTDCAADCGQCALTPPATQTTQDYVSTYVNYLAPGKGAGCWTWANTNCIAALAAYGCEGSASDPGTFTPTATVGAELKSAVCLQTLQCVLTKAAQPSPPGGTISCADLPRGVSDCWCGNAADCLGSGQNGTCKAVEEKGLESTSPSTIAGVFTDPTLASGAANGLIACILASGAGKTACGL